MNFVSIARIDTCLTPIRAKDKARLLQFIEAGALDAGRFQDIRPRHVKAERCAIAPLPPQPIEQGMVGPALLAGVLINKFEYHTTLDSGTFMQPVPVQEYRRSRSGEG